MLKKKWFYTIVVLVTILLSGLIAVQIYWIRDAYRLKEVDFNQKVNRVLAKVVRDAEWFTFSYHMYGRTYIKPGEGIMMLKSDYTTKGVTDTVKLFNAFPYTTHPEDTCFYSTSVSYYDALTVADISVRLESRRHDTTQNASVKNKELRELSLTNFRQTLDDTTHITRRMNMNRLDSVLTALLLEEQIEYEYVYGFRKKGRTTFEYLSDSTAQPYLVNATFKTYLFSDIAFTSPYELIVYIYNKDDEANRSITFALAVSILIILLLIASFIYFIYTVLAQKKVSEMKTDFINNMTHEFMTPVTNIGLALEMLDKQYDKEVLQVIDTENAHLRDNINKVLQVAVLEKGSYFLDLSNVDIHEVLGRVARSFSVLVNEKGGAFVFNLNANRFVVSVDETHIINLFYNIVDNSIKYTAEGVKPVLEISTGNENGRLWVKVKDNAKGMSAEVQKMIFEKFYRAQKGNRHDVKGFGLGLTYVKSIADAHGIKIEVSSTPGNGTVFVFWFK